MNKIQAAEESFKFLLDKTELPEQYLDYVVMEYLFHKGRTDREYINEIMNNFVAGINTLYEDARQEQCNAESTAVAAIEMIGKKRINLKKHIGWLGVIQRHLSNFKCVNTVGLNEKLFGGK